MEPPVQEMDGQPNGSSEIEIQLLTEFISSVYSDMSHVELLIEQSENVIYSLASMIYTALDLDHTVYIYVSPRFKPGLGHLLVKPSVDPELGLTYVDHRMYINGKTSTISMPALSIENYIIPQKYILDIQIKLNGKPFTLFDFINPSNGFDLYKNWFITDPEDNDFDNIIHVNFKNHPLKKGK